jgi:2-oxoglutarate ferredoxin oxidoreductase subunit alpha
MPKREFTFRIGGAAGDGVSSTAESFAKVTARSGLHVWTYSSYQSVIRGGHVWTQVRASPDPLLSHGEDPDVVIALNQQTVDIHQGEIAEGGALVYDGENTKADPAKIRAGVRLLGLKLRRMAQEFSKTALMRNTVALGAAVALYDLPFRHVETAFKDMWGVKKPEVVEANILAAKAGSAAVEEQGGSLRYGLTFTGDPRPLMTGNNAICLGALAAGCKFLAQYPMTPASSIMHWMAAHAPAHGVVVKQVEDELAAVNMAIGAGFAGARSMTATSGGGFSLMVEGLGQGGMTETPVVVVLAQRSGPSTGLPTKTEQGDLNLVLGAGQGDWPRAVLAPRNPEECFTLTAQAFNLAEIYQTPVIVMSDLYLSEGFRTVEPFDFNVPIVRGMMAADGGEVTDFKRYRHTESGVSPRAFPGMRGYQHIAATDEHMENSELISDVLAGVPEFVEERKRQMEKRMRKLDGLRKDTPGPETWGPANADLSLVIWGSTQGPAREAALRVGEKHGIRVATIEFPTLFPFHADEALAALKRAKKTLAVEGNFTGQFTRLLRAETGFAVDHLYAKYDGEPFAPRDIVSKVLEVT